jgi:hypothetical protein
MEQREAETREEPAMSRGRRRESYADHIARTEGHEKEKTRSHGKRYGSGRMDNEKAIIARGQTGRSERLDVLFGGTGTPDGEGHGHLVSNDGLNASYLRNPGEDEPVVDDRWY